MLHADLAVLKAIIHFLKRGSFEHPDGILKRYAMLSNVPPILLRIPPVVHGAIFTLCIYVAPIRNSIPSRLNRTLPSLILRRLLRTVDHQHFLRDFARFQF
jgi:hypothetical protein